MDQCSPWDAFLFLLFSFIDVVGGFFGNPEALSVSYRPFDGPSRQRGLAFFVGEGGLTVERDIFLLGWLV